MFGYRVGVGEFTGCDLEIAEEAGIRFVGYSVPRQCNARFELGIVLDPFCGTGTTLLVAAKLGRTHLGFEINRHYVNLAAKRLAQSPYPIETDSFRHRASGVLTPKRRAVATPNGVFFLGRENCPA